MKTLNRIFLSKYESEDFTLRNKAAALFYYNCTMMILLVVLVSTYAVINPEGILSPLIGASSIMLFVLLSTLFISLGKYDSSVMVYLLPTIIIVIAARFAKLVNTPHLGFTSYLYYNFYIIVFAAVFGKKKMLPATVILFIICNIGYFILAKDKLDPVSLEIAKTGIANSTIVLVITGIVSYINIMLTDDSTTRHKEEAEHSKKQYALIASILTSIREISSSLKSSAGAFRSTAAALNDSAQSQAARLEESSASMEEIASAIEKVSYDSSVQSSSVGKIEDSIIDLDKLIGDVAERAGKIRNESEKAISQGKEAVVIFERVQDGIQQINLSAGKIKEMVDLITDIADRTNLLSLNASIESARAGEAGRGFSVVAEEISKLADNSTASAKEISQLIIETTQNINNGSSLFNTLYSHLRDMNVTLEFSSRLGKEMDEATVKQMNLSGEVKHSIKGVNELSQSISSAMTEQSATAQELSQSLDIVNELTQSNAASAEEVTAATETLMQNAEQLLAIIDEAKAGS